MPKCTRALARLERFRVLRWVSTDTVMLRVELPPPSVEDASRYPKYLVAALLQRITTEQ